MAICLYISHLATECDSQKHLPLHIAAAKGHVEIVKALVSANPETCHARDRDGGNPVHLAAIRGHGDVVKEMVHAQPHAARAMVQQETILHMCVKHNQLEVLKFLIETMGDRDFVNTKDGYGNTILHLAVADKQIQTINFLLLDTTIEVNAINTKEETPMDLLLAQVTSRDLKHQQDHAIPVPCRRGCGKTTDFIRTKQNGGAVRQIRVSSDDDTALFFSLKRSIDKL